MSYAKYFTFCAPKHIDTAHAFQVAMENYMAERLVEQKEATLEEEHTEKDFLVEALYGHSERMDQMSEEEFTREFEAWEAEQQATEASVTEEKEAVADDPDEVAYRTKYNNFSNKDTVDFATYVAALKKVAAARTMKLAAELLKTIPKSKPAARPKITGSIRHSSIKSGSSRAVLYGRASAKKRLTWDVTPRCLIGLKRRSAIQSWSGATKHEVSIFIKAYMRAIAQPSVDISLTRMAHKPRVRQSDVDYALQRWGRTVFEHDVGR